MARINLLPWREERRKELNKQFGVLMLLAALLAGVMVAGAHIYMERLIAHQQSRNGMLEREIKALDVKIKEIATIEKKKADLLARMEVIQQLQGSRPTVVHLFDELVTTLPEGVVIRSIAQSGDNLVIQGVAQSNERVSAYMRNLDASAWLADPALQVISGDKTAANSFTLRVKQTQPGKQEEE